MVDLSKVTRLTIVGPSGRELEKYGNYEFSLQDNNRTLKIFSEGPVMTVTKKDKTHEIIAKYDKIKILIDEMMAIQEELDLDQLWLYVDEINYIINKE